MSTSKDYLHAVSDAWNSGWLDVGEGHRIYYEQRGNPDGMPVLCVHGGPGSGSSAMHARLFDPDRWRVILYDQRGAGRSTPLGGLANNTTDHLIADMERLRAHLAIERWLVCGGSWGSTLALAWAVRHGTACLGVLLRACFLASESDLRWFFDESAPLSPKSWARLAALAPPADRRHLWHWLPERLLNAQNEEAVEIVARWIDWEAALSKGADSHHSLPTATVGSITPQILHKYRVQAHYLHSGCFIESDVLLDDTSRLRGHPVALVHGRLDRICRPINTEQLAARLPAAICHYVEDGDHNPFCAPMAQVQTRLLTHFAHSGHF